MENEKVKQQDSGLPSRPLIGSTAVEEKIVPLKKIRRKPQWVVCPFCQHKIRAQWIPNGVMSGWDEDCKHFYAAGNNSDVEPALVFRQNV